MTDEMTVQLWERICHFAGRHSERWSHLPSDDLASWAFLEVADRDGGLKDWVHAALKDEGDLEAVARLVVNRVAKRLQRAQQRATLADSDSKSGELADVLNELPFKARPRAFRRLTQFLSELPREQFRLLTAYYVERRQLAEIGQEFTLSRGAVANRLLRIRKKIIRFFDEFDDLL